MATQIFITILFSSTLLELNAQAQVPGAVLGGAPARAQWTGALPGAAEGLTPRPTEWTTPGVVTKDITQYGATPGVCISEALLAIWKEAIASPTPTAIVIPPGTWSLSQVKLIGPAKAPIDVIVQGTIQASPDPMELPDRQAEWITINYMGNLTIFGGGVFDGQGHIAWQENDCNKNRKCAKLPMNLSFNFINHTIISDVMTKDSKNFHVNCISSHNVTFQRFHVSAPGESINTDGIHIGRSSMINVIDSTIETGDDCVSIGDESKEIHVHNVTCGPGHGISIGSLGKYETEKDVQGVFVQNCTFKGTTNGVRIKTWPSTPAILTVSNIHFEDLIMENVSNPIIIDQEYCPWNLCDKSKPSLVKIAQVTIRNVRGTCNSAEALVFSCSSSVPCEGVAIGDVNLTYIGNQGPITTRCMNIKPNLVGRQNPPVCAAPVRLISLLELFPPHE